MKSRPRPIPAPAPQTPSAVRDPGIAGSFRFVAIGPCPGCKRSVTIYQPFDPDFGDWGPNMMECVCATTITDVTFPLDQRHWQLLLKPEDSPGHVSRLEQAQQMSLPKVRLKAKSAKSRGKKTRPKRRSPRPRLKREDQLQFWGDTHDDKIRNV